MPGLRVNPQRPAFLRCGEEGFGQFQGQFVGSDVLAEVGPLRGGLAVITGDHALQVGPVLSHPHIDKPALGVVEQRDRVDPAGIDALQVHPDQFLEATRTGDGMRHAVFATEVEVVQPVRAVLVSGSDLVEFVFHRSGEVEVDEPTEVLFEQTGHREGHPRRHQRAALLHHVSAVLNGLDNRGIR